MQGHNHKIPIFSLLLSLIAFMIMGNSNNFAAAESEETTYDFTAITGEELKNNPLAIQILQNIELSKQRLAVQQEKQRLFEERQRFLDEKRQMAEQIRQEELQRMNRQYADYTPEAAYDRFLSTVDSRSYNIFQGQFDYQRQKAIAGHNAMITVQNNGGTLEEARQAYFKAAATTRVELIEVNERLNIQYGVSDAKTQQQFNEFGKLPRTEINSQNNSGSVIKNDESIINLDHTKPSSQIHFLSFDDKCTKWELKAQKFQDKGKFVPPGIAKKVSACNNGLDWRY